jgi:hypothetical protein
LRVVFTDRAARLHLADGVTVVGTKAALQARKQRKYPPAIDVVVAHRAAPDLAALQRLRAAGHLAPIVLVGDAAPDEPQLDHALTTLAWPQPTVSTRTFAPTGRRATAATGSFGFRQPLAVHRRVLTRGGRSGDARAARATAAAPPVELEPLLAGLATAPASSSCPDPLLVVLEDPWEDTSLDEQRAREVSLTTLRGVVDHPALHASPGRQARWLTRLAASGIPVVAELTAPVADLLGPDLTGAIRACRAVDLLDPYGWDAASVRQRRAALRLHGAAHAWRSIATTLDLPVAPAPTVSVLLATNRPDDLLDATRRYAAFTYEPRELIVGLHGDGFPDDIEARLRATAGTQVTARRVPSSHNLGMVLNELSACASGDLVTKMDDDDLYAPSHLDDLVDAMRYSRATLVGKGSEFVYLAEIDTTIRRLVSGAESRSRSIGGGTLMIGRADLRTIGGWQRAPRAVDQRLMDDVATNGGRIHRTHGFGFVLVRRPDGHTWSSDVDYFLRQAAQQWPGLAREAAGV